MTKTIKAISLTSTVNDWLTNTSRPRILHIFDRACNLINERREVLSIVTPQIGNGPFNLVVEDTVIFSEYLSPQSMLSNSPGHLNLGELTVNITDVKLWSPHPDWKKLHNHRDHIIDQLTSLEIMNSDYPLPQFSNFLADSLVNKNISTAKTIASKMAGLGQGLTPSGDDFLMGAIYASWIIHPFEVASGLAKEIAEAAAPLTTSLSGAWLRSAGRGEAGSLWHDLFNALIAGENIQTPIANLLAMGETSGADALTGFIGVFISYAESETLCPS